MSVSLPRFRRLAVLSLVLLIVVVVAGAAVRLTDSGLGCADWPNCSDEQFIDVSSRHSAIEQINRLFSGVVGLVALGVFVASIFVRPRRSDLVMWAGVAFAGVAANAVLGGVSVMVDLHPVAVQGHLLLALGCVAATTVLVRRAGHQDAQRVVVTTVATRRVVMAIAGCTALALATGTVVTGAGPHAGDEAAERLDVAITTAARIHSGTVIATLLVTLWLAWKVRTVAADGAAIMNALSTWIFIALLQGAIGYIQYFNAVPPLLVGAHVFGATLITWATTQLWLDTTTPTSDAPIAASSGNASAVHKAATVGS